MNFRCCVLCQSEDEPLLRRGAEDFSRRMNRPAELECFPQREAFLYSLRERRFDAAIVALPGAIGMETVLNAGALRPALPLVWISDDEAFAIASYRLRIRMFLRSPVTEEQISRALSRCAEPETEQESVRTEKEGQPS